MNEISGTRGKGYFKEGHKLQDPIDRENEARLVAIVAEHGWPKVSEVGEDAALGAFLVAQHSDLASQERYLPLLELRHEEGEAKGAWLALLTDRIQVRNGR